MSSRFVDRYYRHIRRRNCFSCRFYNKKEGKCEHPELGTILTHFLEDPRENCPFYEHDKLGREYEDIHILNQ